MARRRMSHQNITRFFQNSPTGAKIPPATAQHRNAQLYRRQESWLALIDSMISSTCVWPGQDRAGQAPDSILWRTDSSYHPSDKAAKDISRSRKAGPCNRRLATTPARRARRYPQATATGSSPGTQGQSILALTVAVLILVRRWSSRLARPCRRAAWRKSQRPRRRNSPGNLASGLQQSRGEHMQGSELAEGDLGERGSVRALIISRPLRAVNVPQDSFARRGGLEVCFSGALPPAPYFPRSTDTINKHLANQREGWQSLRTGETSTSVGSAQPGLSALGMLGHLKGTRPRG